MDRFADLRFQEGHWPLDEIVRGHGALLDSRAPAFPSVFKHVTPSVVRWVADARGRLLVHDPAPELLGASAESVLTGYDWFRRLDAHTVRVLLRGACSSSLPSPLTASLCGSDGRRRWCLIRMERVGEGPQARWVGTAENIHDWHDHEVQLRSAALAESREHYRWSVELSPQVPWTATPDGSIEEVGPRWVELTGMTSANSVGAGWLDAVHGDDVPRTIAAWTASLASGKRIDIDYRIRLRDGSYRWMRARAAARRDDHGAIIRWYGTLEDIHAQKLAQQALSESEERSRLAVQSARLGIWDFDALTGVRSWSPELRAMLGLTLDQPATPELALMLVHPDDRPKLQEMMDIVARNALPPHFEATLRIHRADNGELCWIRSTGWTTQSTSGRPLRVIVTFLDVTEQYRAQDRIRWAATHDPMTRLPNRALWQATLEDMAERAQSSGERFGLLLFDIDDLKRINDSLGHDAGDALLRGFAEQLAQGAPPDAMVGRLGGDEFGLIAGSLTDSAALDACSAQLLEKVRGPYSFGGRLLECGMSIGGAVFGEHGEVAADLFKAADLALYASKTSGRGRLTLFHSELRAAAQQRSSMIHMAQQIIADDLIMPYYQPKVDLRTGHVLGYEALLRWHHPRLGVQMPATITAAFDHCEIAVALTERMLDRVVADVASWLRAGFDPGRVAINASAADFAQGDFADRVLDHLARLDVPPERFEIEVTETVFLGRGADEVSRALDRFCRAGIRIALDDFGTGYASLSHLKHYPVNVLKIDRSFVSNLEEDACDAAIVDAVVKLGGSFAMEVVAEGVETAAQVGLLLGHGCHIGQGFHLGRPQPEQTVRANWR